jgi:hypothetical protein
VLRPDLDQTRNNLLNQIHQLINFNDVSLRREDLGSHFNFVAADEDVAAIKALFARFLTFGFDALPSGGLDAISGEAATTINLFKSIAGLEAINAPSQQQNLKARLSQTYDEQLRTLAPWLVYCQVQALDPETLSERIAKVTSDLYTAANGAQALLDQRSQEIDSTLKTIRDAAAQAGIVKNAAFFQTEANSHQVASRYWLGATILSVVVSIAVMVTLLFGPNAVPTDVSQGEALYHVASRLLVAGVVYFLVLWAARNYMANRHNAVVNRYRHNALATYEVFVKAAEVDPHIKNAVLLHASQAIYSAQASGYISKESLPQIPTNILDLVKVTDRETRA